MVVRNILQLGLTFMTVHPARSPYSRRRLMCRAFWLWISGAARKMTVRLENSLRERISTDGKASCSVFGGKNRRKRVAAANGSNLQTLTNHCGFFLYYHFFALFFYVPISIQPLFSEWKNWPRCFVGKGLGCRSINYVVSESLIGHIMLDIDYAVSRGSQPFHLLMIPNCARGWLKLIFLIDIFQGGFFSKYLFK